MLKKLREVTFGETAVEDMRCLNVKIPNEYKEKIFNIAQNHYGINASDFVRCLVVTMVDDKMKKHA